jgi:hypothetical protein
MSHKKIMNIKQTIKKQKNTNIKKRTKISFKNKETNKKEQKLI